MKRLGKLKLFVVIAGRPYTEFAYLVYAKDENEAKAIVERYRKRVKPIGYSEDEHITVRKIRKRKGIVYRKYIGE